MELKAYFAVIAAILMAVSSLAAAGDISADGSVKATAAIPDPVEYLYTISTDSDNLKISSVCASVNGSELETVYGSTNTQSGYISDYWDFDSATGVGPFNSFYAAVNITEGTGTDNGERQINHEIGTVAFVLDPDDLKKTLMGTEFQETYNIMLIIPTVYWKSESDVLYLSSSPSYSIGGTTYSGMTAYAHALGDSKTFTNVYPYIGLGVYESSVSDDKLQSVSGVTPKWSAKCDQFKSYANSAVSADYSEYQLWNFYQWTLYKMMAYTVMGTKNSQALLGDGPVGENNPVSVTGLADGAGPYANATSSYSKLFLENSWGSLREFVGDTYFYDRTLHTGNALGGDNLGNGQTSAGVSIPSSYWITSTYSSSEFWDLPSSNSYYSDDVGDYVWSYTGRRMLDAGGAVNYGDKAGVACIYSGDSFTSTNPYLGARLAYVMSDDAVSASAKKIDICDENGGYVCSVHGNAGDTVDVYTDEYRFSGVLTSDHVSSGKALLDVEYPVTLEPGWQASGQSRSYWNGSTLEMPECGYVSVFDHEFIGWSTDGETIITESSVVINSPVTLTAMWDTTSGTCGHNASYAVDGNGLLSIFPTHPGSYGSVNNMSSDETTPWSGNTISGVIISAGIESVGNYVFDNCASLTSVTISDSVTSIGASAFFKCTSLTAVTIPDSVTLIGDSAFAGCTSLSSLSILGYETSFGNSAFYGCQIKTLTLGMKNIGTDFRDIQSLETLVLLDTVESVGKNAFNGCPIKTLTLGMKNIGSDFSGTDTLETLVLLDAVESVGKNAFSRCTSLESVTIPDSVTSIGDSAFEGCVSLSSVTIPKSVTSIGDAVFSHCSQLSSVTIPNSVTSIGYSAFFECSSLSSVTIPNSVTSIGDAAFFECSSLSSVTIPNSVTSIGYSAFCGCTSLRSVTIPNSVTSIGNYAFYTCTSLDSVTIPKSVTSIGDSAFENCDSLAAVTISGSETSIGDSAFENCDSLAAVTISGSETSIGNDAFLSCPIEMLTLGTAIIGHYFSVFDTLAILMLLNTVETIGDSAFEGCTSLLSVTIPDSVSFVAADAFGDLEFYDLETFLTADKLPGYSYKRENDVMQRCMNDGMTFSADGLNYKVVSAAKGTVSVTGCDSNITNLVIPETVSFRGTVLSVTSVGSNAFFKNTNLKTADLGNVTSIGSSAFKQCGNLVSVDVGENLKSIGSYAFYKCFKLKTINLEDSAKTMRSIGGYTFKSCSKISQIAIPSNMNTIGKEAFSIPFSDEEGNVLSLTAPVLRGFIYKLENKTLVRQPAVEKGTVIEEGNLIFKVTGYLPCTMTVTGYTGSIKELNVPDKINYLGLDYRVVSISEKAFYNCRTLISADLGNVTSVGTSAFENCMKLTSVKAEKVKTIGQSAFRWCSKMSSLESGDNVQDIKAAAFYNCKSLSSLDLPDSVKNIAAAAFKGCSGLEEVTFGTGLSSVSNTAFTGISFFDGETKLKVNATNLRGNSFEGTGSILYLTA